MMSGHTIRDWFREMVSKETKELKQRKRRTRDEMRKNVIKKK
jgi:hypothetical protein